MLVHHVSVQEVLVLHVPVAGLADCVALQVEGWTYPASCRLVAVQLHDHVLQVGQALAAAAVVALSGVLSMGVHATTNVIILILLTMLLLLQASSL